VPAVITAIVRYRLPEHIDRAACRDHYEKIAPGFRKAKGLISKHFIWSEDGVAGGVYQWQTLKDAKAFYSGPWRKGIVERYGMQPDIQYFTVFCITDNAAGDVRVVEKANPRQTKVPRAKTDKKAPRLQAAE
jgi:hypothetical protein